MAEPDVAPSFEGYADEVNAETGKVERVGVISGWRAGKRYTSRYAMNYMPNSESDAEEPLSAETESAAREEATIGLLKYAFEGCIPAEHVWETVPLGEPGKYFRDDLVAHTCERCGGSFTLPSDYPWPPPQGEDDNG
jgi:hypothetical protein